MHRIERYSASIFLQKLKDQVCQKQKVQDDKTTLLGDKNGASSGKLDQITPRMSLSDDNEYILNLIGDICSYEGN